MSFITRSTMRVSVASLRFTRPISMTAVRRVGLKDEHKGVGSTGSAETSKEGESAFSSKGSVGKHFNPDGTVGQVGEKIGGPFSKDGAVGSQFDASKDGVAGKVEEAVDGPKK